MSAPISGVVVNQWGFDALDPVGKYVLAMR
jgi:hypothetical protein